MSIARCHSPSATAYQPWSVPPEASTTFLLTSGLDFTPSFRTPAAPSAVYLPSMRYIAIETPPLVERDVRGSPVVCLRWRPIYERSDSAAQEGNQADHRQDQDH